MARIPLSALLVALLLAGAPMTASAQDPRRPDTAASAEDSQRYEFTRMSRWGFMRLDKKTGQVSHCRSRGPGWACEAIPDDRAALEAEIARQSAKIEALEAERARQAGKIAELEADLARRATTPAPGAPPAPQVAPRPEVKLQLPSEEEIDRALRYLETMFRRFVGMVDRLRAEKEKEGGRL
jgi:hypothetical protein